MTFQFLQSNREIVLLVTVINVFAYFLFLFAPSSFVVAQHVLDEQTSLRQVETMKSFTEQPVKDSLDHLQSALFIANSECRRDWEVYFRGINFNSTIYASTGKFDYIVVADRLSCVLAYNILSIFLYQNPRSVYIVAPFEVCRLMILPHNVKCIDEDKWITGLNLQSFQDYFGQTLPTLVQKRDLWFWQQILKLATALRPEISPDFVLVDSDVIFQKEVPYKTNQGKYVFYSGGWALEYYTHSVKTLLGIDAIRASDNSSFVAHSMIMNKDVLISFLKNDSWWKSIINSVKVQTEDIWWLGFSEYTFYSTYFIHSRPDQYVERVPRFIRDKEKRNHIRNNFCPTVSSMKRLTHMKFGKNHRVSKYAYVVWELNHHEEVKRNGPYPSCIRLRDGVNTQDTRSMGKLHFMNSKSLPRITNSHMKRG